MGTTLVQTGQQRRLLRNPQHRWHVRQKPFLIQPVCFAPVLPGETLKNLLFQVRAVSDPVKNPLIGWWKEYYWFYVKHRDLAGSSDFQAMMINPGHSMAAQVTAGSQTNLYRNANRINWQQQCLDVIVRDYFRGENDNPATIDSLPVAQIQNESIFNSMSTQTVSDTGDFNVDLNANATITASEVDRALQQWEFLQANNLTELSYEDYLRTYNVRVEDPEVGRPELIRYVRKWQYPSNTVEPTTGIPSSALSWAISERADKDRFFKEPGFIVGITVTRPKVYLSKQTTSAINLLDDAYSWLPAVLKHDPETSMKRIAAGSTFVDSATAMVIDLRDLFIYGDQFINFALTATDAGLVALPTAGLNKRYPVSSDIEGLFVGTTPPSLIKEDGVVTLSILGTQQDMTPRGSSTGVVM